MPKHKQNQPHPRHDWIVCVKLTGSSDPVRWFKGRTASEALKLAHYSMVSLEQDWTPPMVEYLQDKWNRFKPRYIAEQLSRMTGKRVTKNAVIGKAHRMGIAGNAVVSRDVHARVEGVHQDTHASGAMHRISEAADN